MPSAVRLTAVTLFGCIVRTFSKTGVMQYHAKAEERQLVSARETPGTPAVPLVIGVTGHRNLVAAEIPMLEDKVERVLASLAQRFPDIPLRIMTPLAEGADRLVGRVAQRMGLSITVLLPMPKSIYQADFDHASNAVFEEMLEFGEVVELPLLPGSDPIAISTPGPARDAQYEYLGVYLAAHSHILLALWDGKPSTAPGGTAHVVQFHQEDVVEMIAGGQHRSPIDFSEDESDLVYHIVCSRQQNGIPHPGLEAGDAFWLTRDDLDPRSEDIPVRYLTVFERHSTFNRDLIKNQNETSQEQLAEYDDAPHKEQLKDIHTLYQRVDTLAIRYQKIALRTLRLMFCFVGLTGMSFILYADFSGLDFAIYLYLVFMCFVLSLYGLEKRGDWYRKHLDYRALAEGLRVEFYWALAGVHADNPSRFSHDSFMKRQDLEVGWIRNIMRYAGRRADAKLQLAEPRGLQSSIELWVGDETTGQSGYYKRRAAERIRRSKFTGSLGTLSFALGLLIALVLALELGQLTSTVQNLFIALMGALPFLAAVRQSYAQRRAEKELIAQYAYMERIFLNAHRLIQRASSDLERRDILRALGEAAMDENGLWVLRQRERPISSGEMFQG